MDNQTVAKKNLSKTAGAGIVVVTKTTEQVFEEVELNF